MNEASDRRGFLRSALATSGAFATWSALGRPGVAAEDAKPAAEKPAEVVLGIMGVANRGDQLARGFAAQPGCRVAYICDVDAEFRAKTAEAVASIAGTPPEQVGDFRKILDDKGVNALVIAAPDHWHAPAMILACAAGKHVYVEKPACHNAREGELMVAAARKHKRVAQMGTQRRSSPTIGEGIARLHAGEIGTVRFARGWINSTRPSIGRGNETAPPARLDYTLWQGPAPERPYRDNMIPYHWHWFWHWGTGELGNNGIHALDLCRWGLQVGTPERVTSAGTRLFFDDDQETPDTQVATFVYGNERKAIHWEHRTWHKRGFEGSAFGAQFYGDGGALVISNNDYAVFDMDGKERHRQKTTNGEEQHLRDFLDCIREGGSPRAEIEIGVASTLLCHVGNIALKTGQTVDLDPATARPLNNPAAEALWGREYRSGWEPVV